MKSQCQPWMKKRVLALLSADTRKIAPSEGPRVVQVIACNTEVGTLTISDRDNFIIVMMTSDCIADISKENSILNLRHTSIKIERYHFSTVIQCVGSRDETKFVSQGISFPLTIQCDKLSALGGNDIEVAGRPVDINKDPDISTVRDGLTYIEMTERLGTKQFPEQRVLPNADGKFLTVNRMTDEDAENYEDYIIPPDQQLILDKLNMPHFMDSRVNSNATSRLPDDLNSKYADRQADLLSTADDHSMTDTLLDDEFTDELGREATKYREQDNLTHTLVDETQQDDTDDNDNDNDDDDDDDYIDPSGGFELDVVQSTQNTTVRRSMRTCATVTETLPDEPLSPTVSRKDARTSPQSASLKSPSQNIVANHVPESSARKRRNLDANWLTQPQTQDMMSQDMLGYSEDLYSQQDPVTQASQILLPSAASPDRRRGARNAEALGEEGAEDELYDEDMIGRKIVKTFGRHGTFEGYVQHYCGDGRYLLMYEDGDTEEQYADKIVKMLLPKEEENEVQGDNGRSTSRYVRSPAAPSSSSKRREASVEGAERASKMPRRAPGDIFIRHVNDQDGVRQTLRGKDADPGLYETILRLGYHDYNSGSDEDNEEGGARLERSENRRLRQYNTVSCGYAPDGTVRRLSKNRLRFTSAKLKTLLDNMISPRTNIPQPPSASRR